jgi:hypothetical protein
MTDTAFKAIAIHAGVVGANLFYFFLIVLNLAEPSIAQILNLGALVWSGLALARIYNLTVVNES